jgi:capsular exopolysaccharide synthesis family protein
MLMIAYVLLRPSVYVAHTEILVDDGAILPTDIDDPSLGRQLNMPRDNLDGEIRLIKSALIVEKVIDEVNSTVSQTSPFDLRALWQTLVNGERVPRDDLLARAHRLEAFRSHLKVEADPPTSVITISFSSGDPETAAKIANGLASQFIEQRTYDRQQAIEQTSRQIQRAIKASLTSDLNPDERVRSETSKSGETLPIEQRYARVSEALTNATLELADARAQLAKATAAGSSDTFLDGLSEVNLSSLGVQLHARDRELRNQISALKGRSNDDDVELIRAEADLAVVREQLEGESVRVISKLWQEARGAEARFKELQTQVSDIEAELSKTNESSHLSRLRERDDVESSYVYKEMLKRSKQLNRLADASFDRTRIIEPAVVPDKPSMAGGFLLIGLTAMGAGSVGFLWAGFAEFRRRAFNDAHEVERYLGQSVVGMLPNINGVVPLAANLQLSSREKRWALEGYTFIEGVRGIFNTILPANSDDTSRVVAITSCFPDEGKTILALSLARQSAASGASVLLVEGDMRKFGLATKLSTVSTKGGLVDFLSGKVDKIEDVIVREVESGVDMLLASGPSDDAFALSRSSRLKDVMAEVRGRYDLVIVDCPPVLGVSDTVVLCDLTDMILFVVRWQKTERAAVRSAIRELEPRTIAGVVLTQVDLADHLKFATASKYRYQDEFASYAIRDPQKSDQARA